MGSVTTLKRPLGLPAHWEDSSLIAAVRAHLFGASATSVGEILGASEREIEHWTRTKQWGQLAAIVQPEVNAFLADQMMRLGNKALLALDRRMDEGDPVIGMDGAQKTDDDGNPLFRPLKAKDLAEIAIRVMTERRATLAKQTNPDDDEDKVSLKALAAALKEQGERKIRTIEGEATTQ